MSIQSTFPDGSRFNKIDRGHLDSLSDYLSSQSKPEKALRELKQAFPQWLTLAEDLDRYVQLGILERYDRRYRFALPFLTLEDSGVIDSQVTDLRGALMTLSDKVTLKLAQSLLKNGEPCFYLAEEPAHPQWSVWALKGETVTFLDITFNGQISGLASYFKASKEEKTKCHTIRQRIGDVDEAFFTTFTERTYLLLAQKGKLPAKATVFSETLKDFKYITNNKANWQVLIPLTHWSLQDEEQLNQGIRLIESRLKDLSSFTKELIRHRLSQRLLSQLATTNYVFIQGEETNND